MSEKFTKHWELETETMILFWGGVLSNWSKFHFNIGGIGYNCVEQYMMAQKAIRFDDATILQKIMVTNHPREQKALGRLVTNFDATVWSQEARDLVYPGLLAKFKQNDTIKNVLLSTGDKIIAEASPFDKIWGIGLEHLDPKALKQETWEGTNWLGELTMRAREELRDA